MQFAHNPVRSALRTIKRKLHRPGPVILMYHRVGDEPFDPWGLSLPEHLFRDQLAWLTRHRLILPLPEFIELHRRGKLPREAVAITFDDGYAQTVEVAAPLLEEHDAKATLFIATGLLEPEHEFWWDDLQRIVLETAAGSLSLPECMKSRVIELGDRTAEDHVWPSGTRPQTKRQSSFLKIWRRVRLLSPSERGAAIDELRDQAGVERTPRTAFRPLAHSIVSQLSQTTFDIGAHSVSHADLSKCSLEKLEFEVIQSRDRCRELTGRAPTSFAYPYGDYSEEAAQVVERAGFLCACTVEEKPITRRTSPTLMPRLGVGRWGGPELLRSMARL